MSASHLRFEGGAAVRPPSPARSAYRVVAGEVSAPAPALSALPRPASARAWGLPGSPLTSRRARGSRGWLGVFAGGPGDR